MTDTVTMWMRPAVCGATLGSVLYARNRLLTMADEQLGANRHGDVVFQIFRDRDIARLYFAMHWPDRDGVHDDCPTPAACVHGYDQLRAALDDTSVDSFLVVAYCARAVTS
jgi:hypothetical protein